MSEPNRAAWIVSPKALLHVDSATMPTPGPGQIVVRNRAVAVNPVDWNIQDHGIFIKRWPNIIGSDAAGDVVEVGEGVERFQVGARVTSHLLSTVTSVPQQGGFQLFSLADAAVTASIPQAITYAQASVLPLALDTAAVGLYSARERGCLGLPWPSLDPEPLDTTIVVWGGSSSVGSVAIQLAVASGVRVVTTASRRNFEFCRSCGASEVIDYNAADDVVVSSVVGAVRGTGGAFAGAYDAIAHPSKSYRLMLPIMKGLGGGNMAAVHKWPEDGGEIPDGVRFAHVLGVNDVTHTVWENFVTPALEAGRLKCLPEPMVLDSGLDSVQKGLDENRRGVSARKVVVEL